MAIQIVCAGVLAFLAVRIFGKKFIPWLEKHGFTIKTVGVYTVGGGNEVCTRMEEEIRTFLEGYDDVLQVHGLLVDADRKDINADVVIDYAALRRQMVYDEIEMRLKEKYPEYRVYITRDAS